MKNFTIGLLLAVNIFGAMFLGTEETSAKFNRVKDEVITVSNESSENVEPVVVSNVGDGQEYAYVITEIRNGDYGVEIHGTPLNKESYTNRGIFLYQSEVSFDVKVGDKIVVVWGEEEDEFELIDRAVKNNKGEYISATQNRINVLMAILRANSVHAKYSVK